MNIVVLVIVLMALCVINILLGERSFYKKLWEDQFEFNAKLFRELMQYKNGEGWKDEL